MLEEQTVSPAYCYIASDSDLRQFADQVRNKPVLAIDSEFQRTHTFYPQPGLVQVNDGRQCYIIDPLAIEDFSPMAEVFRDMSIVKLLHACTEDLLLFMTLCGELPRPLFDTQIAAAFTGYGMSVGYANLTKTLLAVDIEKEETRSDWLRRPLSAAQIRYALQDVLYLPPLYHQLQDQLRTLRREQWMADECQRVLDEQATFEDVDSYYLKVNAVSKLNRVGLAILKSLCVWREYQARKQDKPRNHVIKERVLWEVAFNKPQDLRCLNNMTCISRAASRQYGELLLEHVHAALALEPDQLPDLLPKALPPQCGAVVKSLKETVRHIAEQHRLPPEMLVKKHEYNAIVRSGYQTGVYSMPDTLTAWRRQMVEPALLNHLRQLSS